MKKSFSLVIAICIVLSSLTAIISAANKPGDRLGDVLSTDITAYIDGHAIQSYNIGGDTYIVVEDLLNYGFNVVWDAASSRLVIGTERTSLPEEYTAPYVPSAYQSAKVGTPVMPYVYTNIKTYIGDTMVKSYNIGGMTCIGMNDLAQHFASGYVWSQAKKALVMVSQGVDMDENEIVEKIIIPEVVAKGSLKRTMGWGYDKFISGTEYGSWTLYSDGTFVAGNGNFDVAYDYMDNDKNFYVDREWEPYIDRIKTIIIEGECRTIGNSAFDKQSGLDKIGAVNLTKVIMSDSVTRIGADAFCICPNLREVEFSDNITEIGTSAFYACDLREIKLPESLIFTDTISFAHNKNLTRIIFPPKFEIVGRAAFTGCTALETVSFPKTLRIISPEAFDATSLKTVYFYGDMPKGINAKSIPPTATLYYTAGAKGWTSPTYTAVDGTVYKTEIFDPNNNN